MTRSSGWSVSFRFPNQTSYAFLFSLIHATLPNHLIALIARSQ